MLGVGYMADIFMTSQPITMGKIQPNMVDGLEDLIKKCKKNERMYKNIQRKMRKTRYGRKVI